MVDLAGHLGIIEDKNQVARERRVLPGDHDGHALPVWGGQAGEGCPVPANFVHDQAFGVRVLEGAQRRIPILRCEKRSVCASGFFVLKQQRT